MNLDPNTPVWQLTVGQFTELMTSLQPKPVEPVPEEVILNTKEAASYLKVSISTLNRWNKDYLKSDKKGGIRRYRKSELDKILNKSAEKA